MVLFCTPVGRTVIFLYNEFMSPFFVWTRANRDSATKHGVSTEDAEHAVLTAAEQKIGNGVYRVRGRTETGRYVEVIYRYMDEDSNMDWTEVDLLEVGEGNGILIFHARPLTDREKRQLRRGGP